MERISAENGVVYYRSPLIPCTHGFSTRIGGISELPHTKGLNLCFGLGDSDGTVRKNLELFSEAVGFDANLLISVPQIHSDRVRYVTEDNCGEGVRRDAVEKCDGYVTDQNGIVLGVKTADCVPVLIYAPPKDGFGGAVSAVHAGWRGSAKGIVRVALDSLVSLGADINEIRAAIGPCIGKCCYAVKDDFYESFSEMAGRELAETYVIPCEKENGTFFADLVGFNKEMLLRAGVRKENIDQADICTCCDADTFYSHRFSKGKRGSMMSVIAL